MPLLFLLLFLGGWGHPAQASKYLFLGQLYTGPDAVQAFMTAIQVMAAEYVALPPGPESATAPWTRPCRPCKCREEGGGERERKRESEKEGGR